MAISTIRRQQAFLSFGLLIIGTFLLLTVACLQNPTHTGNIGDDGGVDDFHASGVVSDINISEKDGTSFLVSWTAPTDTGTKKDGTALSQEELSYRVYYLKTNIAETPTAEYIRQNNDGIVEVTGVASARIIELDFDFIYTLTVATINSFSDTELEIPSEEVVFVRTETKLSNVFMGDLSYEANEYRYLIGSIDTITPQEILRTSDDTLIVYEITRESGEDFDSVLTIKPDGVIDVSVPLTSNIGTASYLIEASAEGYETKRKRISIFIFVAEHGIRVSTYHSENTNRIPVDLGQAINDDVTKPFALLNEDIILGISNLDSGDFTIQIGDRTANYDVRTKIYKTADENGSFVLSKEELANLLSSDGEVIGISGPGIPDTVNVATYRPSNIYSTYDLQAMRVDKNGIYVLQKNIVFTVPEDETMSNYETVGSASDQFTGKLDGAGYSITSVQIYNTDQEAGNYLGLFGVIEAEYPNTVTVQRLTLIDFKITGNAYVGSVAAWIKRGTVINVNTEVTSPDAGKVEITGSLARNVGNISAEYAIGGGLFGRAGSDADSMQVTIRSTSSALQVTGSGTNSNQIGGLLGLQEKDVTLTDSNTSGSVVAMGFSIGALVGQNNGVISDSSATGSVMGSSNIGALVGSNLGTVSGYATGDVTGTVDGIGGLVGKTSGNVYGYATGDVTGAIGVGGLVGSVDSSANVYGYAMGAVIGNSSVGGLVGLSDNSGTISGYAVAPVSGVSDVGGLIGTRNMDATIFGYARNVVRRSVGNNITFGKTLGRNQLQSGTIRTFSSAAESKVYDGEDGVAILRGASGENGKAASILDTESETTTEIMIQQIFAGFTFGTNIGHWKIVSDGLWPAIYIGDATTGPAAATELQPIQFCIFASNDECESDTLLSQDPNIIRASTYYHQESHLGSQLPVELGPAIKDASGLPFALPESAVILRIHGLADRRYKIHYGPHVGEYPSALINKELDNGVLKVLKSYLPRSAVAIGISGPGLPDILHVATYQPHIYTAEDLQAMRADLDGDYVLQNNIVFPSGTDPNFVAVGDYGVRFTGTLNGADYTISGIRIENNDNYQGLFGVIEATNSDDLAVQRLNLTDFNIKGNAFVGSVAGWIMNGSVEHVHVEASSPDSAKVETSGVYEYITTEQNWNETATNRSFSGGLFGAAGIGVPYYDNELRVNIKFTSSKAKVIGYGDSSSTIGGLLGYMNKTVMLDASFVEANVEGKNKVGGLVGANGNHTVGLHDDYKDVYPGGFIRGYVSGIVLGTGKGVGGLVGYNLGDVTGYKYIENGDRADIGVRGDEFVGGLVGENYYSNVTGHATNVVAGNNYVGGLVGYVGTLVTIPIGSSNENGIITGYSRAYLRRLSGSLTKFGFVIGNSNNSLIDDRTYYDYDIWLQFYQGETSTSTSRGRTGYDGTRVQDIESFVFSNFDIGINPGQWSYGLVGWPSINIGDISSAR